MGWKPEEPPVEVYGVIEASTTKAVLFDLTLEGTKEWIPRSQIVDQRELADGTVCITVKAWLAKKNGWGIV